MSIFGRIVTDDMVEDAVMATLQKWVPTYLDEVERQLGLTPGYYAHPRSWEVRNDFEKWPEEMLPAIIVVSTGLGDTPVKEGRGAFRVPWLIGVACVVSSTEQTYSRRFAYRLGAAIRAALIQRQSLDGALGGTVRGVTWLDGRNNEMPPDGDRTIWATRQVFNVEVGDVMFQGAGPNKPTDQPAPDTHAPVGDWPTVPDRDHVQQTIIKEPING